jgi:hypothetical protein
MSSVLQTPKINARSTLKDRKLNLLIIVAFVVTLVVILSGIANSPSVEPKKDYSWPPRPVFPVREPAAIEPSLAPYYLSERTMVDPNAGLAIYHSSERAFIDPQAGLTAYYRSERTSTTFRDLAPFNEYQRSEWFGK